MYVCKLIDVFVKKDKKEKKRKEKRVSHLRPVSERRGHVGSALKQQWQSATYSVHVLTAIVCI